MHFAERGEPGPEHQHASYPQAHRGKERADGDQRHRAATPPQRPYVDLVTHCEHEDHDTDLRERRQRRQHHRREQVPGEVTGQPPEQARPEKQSGQHLADDGRLAQSPGHGAEQDGNRDHQCDIADDGGRDAVHHVARPTTGTLSRSRSMQLRRQLRIGLDLNRRRRRSSGRRWVIPARSRYSSSGIATRRVVPSACLASAVVNGCESSASNRAARVSAPGASTICSVTRSSSPARAAAATARASSPSSAQPTRLRGHERRRREIRQDGPHPRDDARRQRRRGAPGPAVAHKAARGSRASSWSRGIPRASASISTRSGRPRAARAASGDMPMASGSRSGVGGDRLG